MNDVASLPILWTGPAESEVIIVLAHGAGAAMDSPFMDYFANGLAEKGARVLRFEFPYMAERRLSGRKRPPEREARILTSWRQIMSQLPENKKIYIGGKSMGGRMASLLADEMTDKGLIAGLICLGYPFHAVGKQDRPRTAHLKNLQTPTLILQGERDPMGNAETVGQYDLSNKITVHWLVEGNHDLSPRKKSGKTAQENWDHVIDKILGFVTVGGKGSFWP